MAYPQLRSMNDSLVNGATDGKYKKLRPDTQCMPMDTEATYTTRRALNLPYYGVGEPKMFEVPGRNSYVRNPDFTPNKFEMLEDNSILGETW